MDGSAVNAIAELAEKANLKTIEIDGVTYASTTAVDVRRPDPVPKPLVVGTLACMVDYLMSDLDDVVAEAIAKREVVVQVVSPWDVRVVGTLQEYHAVRPVYCKAVADDVVRGMLERHMPVGDFIPKLMSQFKKTAERDALLQVLGNVREGEVKTSADDGTTQTVTARQGVAVVADVAIPNPIELVPYRTFPEVEQPLVPFVVRLQGGPSVALFECDGGRWQLDACQAIYAYLYDKLEEQVQVIA